MKNLLLICLILFFTLFAGFQFAYAQNTGMNDNEMEYRINKLLNEYNIHATLVDENGALSPLARQRFLALFTKNAKVYNELPDTPNFGKKMSVSAYADQQSEWFPQGLTVQLSKPEILRSGVHQDLNYDSMFVVSSVKTFSGVNKAGVKVEKKSKKLYFVLGYDKDSEKLIITAISNMEETAVTLAEFRVPKSKKTEENPPLQVGVGIMPGFGNLIGDLSGTGALFYENLSGLNQTITFSFGTHAYLLLSVGSRMQWGVGLGTSRLLRRLTLDSYTGTYQATDNDGENYTRNINISNLSEEYLQNAMNLPLFIRYNITKTGTLSVFTDVGFAFGMNITGKHTYGGTFTAFNTYERTQPEIYTFTLRSEEGEEFDTYNNHYGLYENLTISDREIIQENQKLSLKSFQAAMLLSVGSTFKLSNRLYLFGTARAQMGISDINNSAAQSGKRMLLPNANQYNSIMTTLGSPLRPVMVGAEMGILFNLKN